MIILKTIANNAIITLTNEELEIIKLIFDNLYLTGTETLTRITPVSGNMPLTRNEDLFLKMKAEMLKISL